MSDSFFSESETGAAVGEVRKTDPDFSIRELEMEMQEYMLPIVLKSYLASDIKFMASIMDDTVWHFCVEPLLACLHDVVTRAEIRMRILTELYFCCVEQAMRSVLAEHKQREAAGHKPDFFLLTLAAVKVSIVHVTRPCFQTGCPPQVRHRRVTSITECISAVYCVCFACLLQCETASFQGHIPIFALNFQWQYRHLVRDRAGKIIEGSEV